MKRFWLYNAQPYTSSSSIQIGFIGIGWFIDVAAEAGFPGFSSKNVDLVEMDAWCPVARKAAFDAFYACDRFGETISFLVGGAQHWAETLFVQVEQKALSIDDSRLEEI